MNKIFKKVLVVYKKSAFTRHFLNLKASQSPLLIQEEKKIKLAHEEHHDTLMVVEKTLKELKINYETSFRGDNIDFSRFSLIITVGGDGTFLQAASQVKNQFMLGVNSAINFSVGKLCRANIHNFNHFMNAIVTNKFRTLLYHRLNIDLKNQKTSALALNDLLVAHENPALMSRYSLKIGSIQEEQRSSGIWISSPVGSSGAMRSAGGKFIPLDHKKIQYLPRELYQVRKSQFKLKGSVLNENNSIEITSLMPHGRIYIDGGHILFPFSYAEVLKVSMSKFSIKTISI